MIENSILIYFALYKEEIINAQMSVAANFKQNIEYK